MLFAHLKRILKLDRLRLRGPNGARDEFLLSNRPKPPKAGEADTDAKHSPSLRPSAPRNRGPSNTGAGNLKLLTDFFNKIGQQETLHKATELSV